MAVDGYRLQPVAVGLQERGQPQAGVGFLKGSVRAENNGALILEARFSAQRLTKHSPHSANNLLLRGDRDRGLIEPYDGGRQRRQALPHRRVTDGRVAEPSLMAVFTLEPNRDHHYYDQEQPSAMRSVAGRRS